MSAQHPLNRLEVRDPFAELLALFGVGSRSQKRRARFQRRSRDSDPAALQHLERLAVALAHFADQVACWPP